MYIRDHLEKLRYFHEVARLGSMKKASMSVFISQPSLTKSIKVLEDTIGKPLFIRRSRGMDLTEEGNLLFVFCNDLFSSLENLEQQLSNPLNPLAGSLRIGTYDSLATYFWPIFLKYFLPKYPMINFEMTTGRSIEMQEKLESGELDLILVIEPKESKSIVVDKLMKDSFKCYETTSSSKVYKNKQDASLIVMTNALVGKKSLQDIIESTSLSDKRIYKSTSLDSVKELTLNGIGIGLLPQMVAKKELNKKTLKEVKLTNIPRKGFGEHSIGIAYQKSRKDSLLVKTLIEELKEHKW